jgi:hypothetical protein
MLGKRLLYISIIIVCCLLSVNVYNYEIRLIYSITSLFLRFSLVVKKLFCFSKKRTMNEGRKYSLVVCRIIILL